jgi:hypothetical protein
MSKGNKVTFKVILTSEIEQPYKVISVPEEAPFSAVIRYVCDEVRSKICSFVLMKKQLQFSLWMELASTLIKRVETCS